MFEKIKDFFVTVSLTWKYSSTIRSVLQAWSKFPGWHDSELLRLWIRHVLTDAVVLTALTKTPIDDVIAVAAIRIVDNNTSWAAAFALAQLVRDGFGMENSLIPQSVGDVSVEGIAREACPECPAVGLAALGVLLYLLQQRRV